MLNHVLTFATPWTIAHQAPLSMEFSRQEYWSGLLFSTPGDLPNPGIKTMSFKSPILVGRFFITLATKEALVRHSPSLNSVLMQDLNNENCEIFTTLIFLLQRTNFPQHVCGPKQFLKIMSIMSLCP